MTPEQAKERLESYLRTLQALKNGTIKGFESVVEEPKDFGETGIMRDLEN